LRAWWRKWSLVQRERLARLCYGWALKLGGPAEAERSREHFRKVPTPLEAEVRAKDQRELLDRIAKAKQSGARGHDPF